VATLIWSLVGWKEICFSFYSKFIFKCKRISVISQVTLKDKDGTLDLHV
jgi:hypothetical protein